MLMLVLAVMVLILPPARAPQAPAPDTHCTRIERIVFSCATASKKVISLCASRPPRTPATMQYRFGPPTQLELVYPRDDGPLREHFRGSRLMYAGGGGAWIAFDNGGFTYFVYTAVGKDFEKEGIVVRKGDAIVASLLCEGPFTSEIGPAFFEEADLPSGADEFDVP